MSEQRVYIDSIRVHDFGGLEEFHANTGKIAVVTGRNGAGKTTIIEAIKSVFEGGADPAFIRKGADEAIIEIVLSNCYTAKKTIRKDGFDLVVTSPEGGKIKAPKKWLEQLAPSLAFDPIGFLDKPAKDRADFLLRTLPLSFTGAEVNEAVMTHEADPNATLTLQQLNQIRELKYTARTSINVQQRDLEGTINDMRKSLPPDDSTDWGARRDELNEKIVEIRTAINADASLIHAEKVEAIAAQSQEAAKKKAALSDEYHAEKNRLQQLMNELEARYRDNVNVVDAMLERFVAKAEQAAAETLAEKTADMNARLELLQAEFGEAKTNADAAERVQGIRDAIAGRKKALDDYISKERMLTKAIEQLDALKHRRLKDLPIDGLDLQFDGKIPVITIDGIPLDQINRQQQIYIAIQLVSESAGKLPLILCEAAELDDSRMKELAGACKDSGIQLVAARWKDNAPLQVLEAA